MQTYTLKNRDIEISEEELTELNRQKESKKSGVPEMEQRYWYVDSAGEKDINSWRNNTFDLHHLYTNNLFLTEEKCDEYLKYVNALKAITKFKIENSLNDFKADWTNGLLAKWYIELLADQFGVEDCYIKNSLNLLGYYASKEDAQRVIDNCKAEILLVANYQR